MSYINDSHQLWLYPKGQDKINTQSKKVNQSPQNDALNLLTHFIFSVHGWFWISLSARWILNVRPSCQGIIQNMCPGSTSAVITLYYRPFNEEVGFLQACHTHLSIIPQMWTHPGTPINLPCHTSIGLSNKIDSSPHASHTLSNAILPVNHPYTTLYLFTAMLCMSIALATGGHVYGPLADHQHHIWDPALFQITHRVFLQVALVKSFF